ncbi:hypothetical protein B0H17DRAFT_1138632 [Mycena rosella]|uniref:Uncharacterized protein n=1 Tax=Mycena rosella TaxID=1033263 RepID=A0AAD7D5Z5_MYCRO|nr:hypothetical protein B0H17DRAFT_1138632 [Mycena rosella]
MSVLDRDPFNPDPKWESYMPDAESDPQKETSKWRLHLRGRRILFHLVIPQATTFSFSLNVDWVNKDGLHPKKKKATNKSDIQIAHHPQPVPGLNSVGALSPISQEKPVYSDLDWVLPDIVEEDEHRHRTGQKPNHKRMNSEPTQEISSSPRKWLKFH